MSRYRRVVLKLSGEALAGTSGWGVEPAELSHLADEVLSVHSLGAQVAVVVGGGNYFRGRMADNWGIGRAEADNIGMLGTVMNALMLRGALTGRTDADVRVMTAMPIQSVAEPFIRLRASRHLDRGAIVILAGGIGQPFVTTDYPAVQRALELDADALLVAKNGVDGVYDSDPRTHPSAKRYDHLTFDEALAAGVRVMDTSALVLASEQGLTMHVFDVGASGAMRQICEGADIGTKGHVEAVTALPNPPMRVDLADILSRLEPLARDSYAWGPFEITATTFAGEHELPDDLIVSIRCLTTQGAALAVCQVRDGSTHVWPGGRREAGETWGATVRREVREETGLEIEASTLRVLGFLHLRHDNEVPEDHPYPSPDFLQVVLTGEASGDPDGWRDTEGWEQATRFEPLAKALLLPITNGERALIELVTKERC